MSLSQGIAEEDHSLYLMRGKLGDLLVASQRAGFEQLDPQPRPPLHHRARASCSNQLETLELRAVFEDEVG